MASNLTNIEFVLNHELMQFTRGKTEKTLKAIAERHVLRMQDDKHSIDVIITNKNLQETEQWKIRTINTFRDCKDIHINVLSSKFDKNDKQRNHRDVSTLISLMTRKLNLNQTLPNIIIMCCHSKRVTVDCVELLESFCNNPCIRFNFIFDESDSNLGIISTFLNKVNDNEYHLHSCIDSVEFVTATPFDEFWKMLSEHGIYNLINPDHCREVNYVELFERYRELEEHRWTTLEDDTLNPLEYIKHCFDDGLLPTRRNIVFAPGHIFSERKDVGSHEEVKQYFIDRGYTVLIHNGKHKCFCEKGKKDLSIEDFKKQHDVDGEFRDILRQWNSLYPQKNLAITGNWTIERGVTFNTNGFNFTHMIVSSVHSKKPNRLLQLLGRANGNKQFVDVITIISPKAVENLAKSFVATLKDLRLTNPERYNPVDFSMKQQGTIPVQLDFQDEDYRQIVVKLLERRVRNYATHVHNAIKEGIQTNRIIVNDKNNVHKFDINTYRLKTIRQFRSEAENKNNRRFEQFAMAFEKGNACSQQCAQNEYCLDLTIIDYVKNEFINKRNIAWITFRKS